jgi:putative flippase GtrA
MINLIKKLLKIRIINFMLVGGIGFCVSMAVYYPLTILLKDNLSILGQQFYLPATLISIPCALSCNYYLNKKYTYKNVQAKQLSYGRYLVMGGITAIGDVFVLFLLVQFGHLFYMVATVIATLLMFLSRYFIANAWIWNTKKNKNKTTEEEIIDIVNGKKEAWIAKVQ